MNRCAAAGLTSSGRTATPRSSASSADANASGFPRMRSGRVGLKLPRPGDGQLDERRRDRSQEDRHQHADQRAGPVVVAVPATEAAEVERPLSQVRQERDRSRHRGDDRGDESVAIPDVRQLVSDHGGKLVRPARFGASQLPTRTPLPWSSPARSIAPWGRPYSLLACAPVGPAVPTVAVPAVHEEMEDRAQQ